MVVRFQCALDTETQRENDSQAFLLLEEFCLYTCEGVYPKGYVP
jgi:hypothetical protein